MRKILFRGKLEEANGPYYPKGKWIFGDLRTFEDAMIVTDGGGHGTSCFVDPATVGQFTGLHDSTPYEDRPEYLKDCKKEDWKGMRIYEGDIVGAWDEGQGGIKGYIEYSENAFCIVTETHKGEKLYNARWIYAEKTEVIGNIHEHGDLLK